MQQSQPRPSTEWHRLTADETRRQLDTNLDRGLSAATAHARLAGYGPNTFTPQKGSGPLKRVLAQFNQPLIIILIVAGVVTAALQEWVDSGVIFGVVVLNALVGYLQEAKAIKALEALTRIMTTEATVLRDGNRVRLSAADLVPGDVVVLQAGDKIPADLRLTSLRDLHLDESTLTGESLPVEKATTGLDADTPLADRTNMAYASTLVTSGQGAGVVIATGDSTEVGRISSLIAQAEKLQTPLTRKITQFSRMVLFVILSLAVLTAVVGVLRGNTLVDVFLVAVALAVGAIPEGLPAVVTITLAIGVSRMAQRRAIIRALPAVETLGGTTVICSDKTGTLTENQMTVQRIATMHEVYTLTGTGYAPQGAVIDSAGAEANLGPDLTAVLRAGVLCNDSSLYLEEGHWYVNGDPTEGALLVSAAKAGLNCEEVERHFPRLDTVPFESEHQYMATLHGVREVDEVGDDGGDGKVGGDDWNGRVAYVKGAVEKVAARCSLELAGDGSLVPFEAERIESLVAELASGGLRVLAFAQKDLPDRAQEITHEHVEDDLVFLGLQGMIDPPRQEALEAIRACHAAGIKVKMITGDHVSTAVAIGEQLNLRGPNCSEDEELAAITGTQLADISDADLTQAVEDTYVFARVTPEQKLRLVNALQDQGHVVAMTGDGVNDAPALRQADIGVAMGITGTDVAKEAADMVLTDDNFASIEAAIEEGRGVFDNLSKFIVWTLPTNLGEALVVLIAVFSGALLPILPVQILWVNMTTSVLLGLMLAFEPKEAGIMERPPRPPGAPILDSVLIGRLVLVGILLLSGAYGLFELAVRTGHSLEVARTVTVNVFVFGEMFYLFNSRSLTLPSWKMSLRTNPALFGGVALMVALQLLYIYLPGMNTLFGSAPVDAGLWIWVIGVSVAIHVIVETEKAIRRRQARNHPPAVEC